MLQITEILINVLCSILRQQYMICCQKVQELCFCGRMYGIEYAV